MTTMDSDSESQDSDEGRRFRFEATRKDATASVHSRKRRSSPSGENSRRRSRSHDRFAHRDRRDVDRSRPIRERNKESQSSSDLTTTSSFRDLETKQHSKDVNDSSRSSSRYRDSKDPKHPSNHKEWRDFRESSFKKSRKESRPREREKPRSHERSTDRNYEEKVSDNKSTKFRDRNKRQSRERSRERSHQTSSTKIAQLGGRHRDESSKTESSRKVSRKHDNERNYEDAERNIDNAIFVGKSQNTRRSPPSSNHECKDLNLSDFDIVSDTEENSSDNSGSRHESREPGSKPFENNKNESGGKKRISKEQYERLLKGQVTNKHCNFEDLHKVKAKNGDESHGRGNNNRSAVSNFLLGPGVMKSTVPKLSATNVNKSVKSQNQLSTSDSSETTNKQSIKQTSDKSNSFTNDLTLTPKSADLCSAHNNEVTPKHVEEEEGKQISPSKEKEKVPVAPRIIGPTLPAHLRQSNEDTEMDIEDTFGPALPPHLAIQKDVDNNSEDGETASLALPLYKTSKGNFNEEDNLLPGPEMEEDDDEDTIGPLPPDHPAFQNDIVQQRLESRARRLKAELAACDSEVEEKREEWMLELPPAQSVSLGLGPRKFRVRPAPDMSDRSSWTDTPADRIRKQIEKHESRNMDRESTMSTEREISSAPTESEKSRKRPKSLLEIHQKKLQKKKKKQEKEAKKTGKTIERRPFDRDVDLQVNNFDDARKKSILLKARELDDRFARGKI